MLISKNIIIFKIILNKFISLILFYFLLNKCIADNEKKLMSGLGRTGLEISTLALKLGKKKERKKRK